MASCTRAAGLLLAASLLLQSGCWTGRVYELGRVRESVWSYERAWLDRDQILLDYRVELADRHRRPRSRASRAVAIPRRALRAEPELPVDAFPVREIRAGRVEPGAATPLPVVEAQDAQRGVEAPFLEVVAGETGVSGFRLCLDAETCRRPFRSEALYRDRTAWWVYPLLPFSAALDVAFIPLHAIGLAPFFLMGD